MTNGGCWPSAPSTGTRLRSCCSASVRSLTTRLRRWPVTASLDQRYGVEANYQFRFLPSRQWRAACIEPKTMSDLKVSPAPRGFALAYACVLSLAAAQTPAADHPSSVLGDGWGLDHVLVGLADPRAVKDVFAAKLGFTPHAGIKFPGLGLERGIRWGSCRVHDQCVSCRARGRRHARPRVESQSSSSSIRALPIYSTSSPASVGTPMQRWQVVARNVEVLREGRM